MLTKDIHIRDPFVYVENGTYYLYASFAKDGKRCIAVYTGSDLVNWSEPQVVFMPPEGFWGTRDFWAPEMHAYNGSYYLFGSFIADGRKRATAILKADSPMGPFAPWGCEQITPMDWMCLDGTLHVDENGKPWMVFCHEWVQINNGTMCAVPLKEDLSGPDGDVTTLFAAGDAPWVRSVKDDINFVTDGPFLYRSENGTLNMLWSTFSDTGYSVARAYSESGSVLGPWKHDARPVYPKDGGHCMLFRDLNGQMRMSLHGPNHNPMERARYIPIEIRSDGSILVGNE